jgi:hypothetical protein
MVHELVAPDVDKGKQRQEKNAPYLEKLEDIPP